MVSCSVRYGRGRRESLFDSVRAQSSLHVLTGDPYAFDRPSPAPGFGIGADELYLAAPVQPHAGHRVVAPRGGRVALVNPAVAKRAGHSGTVRCVRTALCACVAHDLPTPPLAFAGHGVAPS